MNLIFIYGPPAVGKLTVAEELVKQNGYKLFHNHLTQDLAKEIYPEFNLQRFKLADKLRLDVFEYAASNNTDLVFTYVFDGDDYDKQFVADTVKAVASNNGRVCFVQLTAPIETLLERVDNESRRRYQKIKNRNELSAFLSNRSLHESVPFDNQLVIDTAKTDPAASARQIIKFYEHGQK